MNRGLMLVEGAEDRRVLPELLEKAGIPWGAKGCEVVRLHAVDGFENLTEEEIGSQLKQNIERFAILVDADDDPTARWASLRSRLHRWFPGFPTTSPAGGVVLDIAPGQVDISPRLRRVGVWMMPDNQARGMLETFLLALRPDTSPEMFAHVERSTDIARQIGVSTDGSEAERAVFKQVHRDKALIHTWLAWHGDPPGRQLHQAIMEKTLDPTLPFAAPFVAWFKQVFELP